MAPPANSTLQRLFLRVNWRRGNDAWFGRKIVVVDHASGCFSITGRFLLTDSFVNNHGIASDLDETAGLKRFDNHAEIGTDQGFEFGIADVPGADQRQLWRLSRD